MKFILGTKQHMVTVFDEDGIAHAATIIVAEPAVVTQLKTTEKEGYNAVQIGSGQTKENRVSKAQRGHAKGKALKYFKEFKQRDGSMPEGVEVGGSIDVSVFTAGEKVTVSALSKAKGFQGVIKRHGFHGGKRTHGQKHSEREAGSISGGTREGGRVPKGMRMAGRMGGDTITIKGLKIVGVSAEEGIIFVKGSIPGRRGTLVTINSK